jgi:ankyrin repeat protein
MVEALLDNGAEVNARNYERETALHEAAGCVNNEASQRQLEVAKTLLDRGADMTAATFGGRTVLHGAVQGQDSRGRWKFFCIW